MKNKSIIITGAASGMGAASARKFSKSGANVTIVDINEDLAFQVANEIKTADPIIGDIGDSSFCNKVIESTIERYGKVDVLELRKNAISRLRKEPNESAQEDTEEEVTNDDFEKQYKGEVSKSGVAILPSKRMRKAPVQPTAAEEDKKIEEKKEEPDSPLKLTEEVTEEKK